MNSFDKYNLEKIYNISIPFVKDETSEANYLKIVIAKARTSLYFDLPFFGWILSQLEVYPVRDDPRIPKFAADNRRIYINTKFFEILSIPQIKTILLHLVIHIIMKHGERMNRNKTIWSYAIDVNTLLIIEETFRRMTDNYGYTSMELFQSWDLDDTSKIPDFLKSKSVIEVYNVISNYVTNFINVDTKIPPNNIPTTVLKELHNYCNIGKPCSFIDVYEEVWKNMPMKLYKLDMDRMSGLIRSAYNMQKSHGYIPGAIQEVIDQLIKPRIPWYVLLNQYIQKVIMSDFSWVPPNRRLLAKGIILPSTIKEFIEVVVALDTSGSISDDELTKFVSEAHSIIVSFANVKMHIIECDAEIQDVMVIEEGECIDGRKLPWEGKPISGRGGTSFIPVFDYVAEQNIAPDLLIYFTDGYGDFPDEEPAYTTIWVMTTNVEPPWGNLIKYEEEDIS